MNAAEETAVSQYLRPIVLVGLMGAGKTTVGRSLAARLRLPFVDSDHEIERAANVSIPDLFERYGEQHFRDGERRVIARLLDGKPKVIATGGGAFMNECTRTLILERGYAVWLDADIDILAGRVLRRPGQRPLLQDRDPRIALAELAAVRNPIYALARICVRNQSKRHAAAVEEIIKGIEAVATPSPACPKTSIT
ncbi:MAG: shikimate kinase [Sphingomonas sp.]|nr:shikimate kinase [Sphingomonas sp.]